MDKIAFIICYNNEMYMNECIKYISELKVPEGVETDIIGVNDAKSMTSGYNAAMKSSDAKYKVYLHQDLLIVDDNFIYEVIDTFRKHPEYGLLGSIGAKQIVKDANYWANWDIGATYGSSVWESGVIGRLNNGDILEAVAVDGQIMVTQYDIDWREDLFDGFDFYDISQCMEFVKKGYKVGIPHQDIPWCDHVCAYSKLERYDYYREIFCREYGQFGHIYSVNKYNEKYISGNNKIEKTLPAISNAWDNGDLRLMDKLVMEDIYKFNENTLLWYYTLILTITMDEINKNIPETERFYYNTKSLDELIVKYDRYRFVIKSIYYGRTQDINELLGISDVARDIIIKHSCMQDSEEK